MGRSGAIVLVIGTLAVGGCGGSEAASPSPTPGGAAPVKRQKVERFATDFDAAQAQRLFGDSQDGVDPKTLVGRWEMQLNTTLGLLELRAPDGGGPVLEIVKRRGNVWTFETRDCPDGFTLRVERAAGALRLGRGSGRCAETIDVLVEEPWQPE